MTPHALGMAFRTSVMMGDDGPSRSVQMDGRRSTPIAVAMPALPAGAVASWPDLIFASMLQHVK